MTRTDFGGSPLSMSYKFVEQKTIENDCETDGSTLLRLKVTTMYTNTLFQGHAYGCRKHRCRASRWVGVFRLLDRSQMLPLSPGINLLIRGRCIQEWVYGDTMNNASSHCRLIQHVISSASFFGKYGPTMCCSHTAVSTVLLRKCF